MFYLLPPRAMWKIQVNINRADAAELCEQLHHMVSKLTGAAFYYPDIEHNQTTCRYEFHYPLKRQGEDIRLGLSLTLGESNLTEIEAYATTAQHIESLSGTPEFSEALLAELQERAECLLNEADQRRKPGSETIHHCIFHLEVPYRCGFKDTVSLDASSIKLFPTRIIKSESKRISAILISRLAKSNEAAKIEALREVGIISALATLATGQLYKQAYPQTSQRHKILQQIDNPNLLNLDDIYPYRKEWPELESVDPTIAQRVEWVQDAFQQLNSSNRKIFLSALFAYYAGSQRQRDFSTLSIVAHVATLSSLAVPNKSVCHGTVSCSSCGELNMRHNKVGDAAAIVKTIKDELALEAKQVSYLKKLIERVYHKQRSAYVHGAELRHGEYHQGSKILSLLPTSTEPVQELAYYEQDLSAIVLLTRRTLLNWLANRTSNTLDKALFNIDDERINKTFSAAATIGLKARTWAVLDSRTESHQN